MTTSFRPISYYKDVAAVAFDSLAGYSPETPATGSWPTPGGGAGRTGRCAEPLLHDRWSTLWESRLGPAERPDTLLIGRERIVVNGADQRGVWRHDGQGLGYIPRTPGTSFIDVTGQRLLFDDMGGLTTYSLELQREASVILSFPTIGTVKEVLQGPGALVLVTAHTPPRSSGQVVVQTVLVRDYSKIKNGILYGLEPVAGIIREVDGLVRAAAARSGPVLATRTGILWCDWQLRALHELPMSGTPVALSVDNHDRAYLILHDGNSSRLLIIPPGGASMLDLALPSMRYAEAGPPIIAASGLAYLTPPRAVLAVSPTGKILWEQPRSSAAPGCVSLNGLLLVADDGLDAVMPDGRHLTLWHPPAAIRTAPVLANGLIHIATTEMLHVLQPYNG